MVFQCRNQPFSGNTNKIFSQGKEFFRAWYADTGTSPPSVLVTGFDPPETVLINWLKKHLDAKPIADKVSRYRILPCVRELLENTNETPVRETEAGQSYYVFYGTTPNGWEFKVAVKRDQAGKFRLISCYRSRT